MRKEPGRELIPEKKFRSGYLALAGRPNVGKSTLLNCLLEQKLSIITPKPQTTRNTILGVWQNPEAQIAILDTPGIFAPRRLLQEIMVASAFHALRQADLVLFLTEAGRENFAEERETLEKIFSLSRPVFLALNKIDRLADKSLLLPQMKMYSQNFPFQEILPISARAGEGIPKLLQGLIRSLPPGPPLFPPDFLTDRPERFFASEIIREAAFSCLREEIPYSLGVRIEEFRENSRAQGKDFIRATILVERDNQRAIVLGRQGRMIKNIGEKARHEMEKFLGRPVYLELWVKVYKNWMENRSFLQELGYEPDNT
ncbi:MAG: GTPase Era [Proteobacteria bacterium]|nr:GTPase Era [Pseudomonadota bacterium]